MKRTISKNVGDRFMDVDIEIQEKKWGRDLSICGAVGRIVKRDEAEAMGYESIESWFEDDRASLANIILDNDGVCSLETAVQYVMDTDGPLASLDVIREDGDDVYVCEGGGQCTDSAPDFFPGLDVVWNRWHLNGMKAGCVHQRQAGWGHGKYVVLFDKKQGLEESDLARLLESGDKDVAARLIGAHAGKSYDNIIVLNVTKKMHQEAIDKEMADVAEEIVKIGTKEWSRKIFPRRGKDDGQYLKALTLLPREQRFDLTNGPELMKLFRDRKIKTPFKVGTIFASKFFHNFMTQDAVTDSGLNGRVFKDSLGAPCPVCGYEYGTSWLRDELPEVVVDWAETWDGGEISKEVLDACNV